MESLEVTTTMMICFDSLMIPRNAIMSLMLSVFLHLCGFLESLLQMQAVSLNHNSHRAPNAHM
jgi:hypothetical protein